MFHNQYLNSAIEFSYMFSIRFVFNFVYDYFFRPTDDIHMRLMNGVADTDNTTVDFIDVGCFEK